MNLVTIPEVIIREQDPLKQGLKLECEATIFTGGILFVSKIH